MQRTRRGSVALLLGIASLIAAPGAAAQQAPDLYDGVQVTPSEVTSPDTAILVTGPPFQDGFGCAIGNIQAIPQTGSSGVVSLGFTNANVPDNSRSDGRWAVSVRAGDRPLAATTYTLELVCLEGVEHRYSTGLTLTVRNSATTTTTIPTTTTLVPTTTTAAPPSVDGSVDPTTAKPGETTITVRGGGFKPGATLQISLATTPVTALGSTTALPTGFYAATLKVPANAPPGTHQLVVSGPTPEDAPRTTTATLTVTDLDCADFAGNAQAAQAALAGGRDPHGLDADKDGVACDGVAARTATGTGGGAPAGPSGSLPATGGRYAELGIMVGITAMTLGALLVGLSHPAEPARPHGRHRRRRWSR